ncbi:MAG TPA: phosphatase PAP2 family protein [Candidatus Polarisedimenticolia bacterium]|jgi:membrane-associated phospholipid phosphatase|nr:phosphatase PAP2 family protein [Candidatus Polarisedimenticolia bacterium]
MTTGGEAVGWTAVRASLARPYRLTLPMVLLWALVPIYIFIAEGMPRRALHAPAIPLDRVIPLVPAWGLVYGSLYLFLIMLPVFVVTRDEAIRRTASAYLFVWMIGYACFLIFPTLAPRPASVPGVGFAAAGLRFLYSADPPYNCFPSLHVAHSFVSAFACARVHRRVGIAATTGAALVALSVLFAKQHFVLDVVAGLLLACVADLLFLRGWRRDAVPESDRRLAPVLALGTLGFVALVLACCWMAYRVALRLA